MADCLFCSIATGAIPADVVRETERTVAFRDINPQAPIHVLVIPRTHHDDVSALTVADPALTAEVVSVAAQVAAAEGLETGGYRLVFNKGRDGGQTVGHVHVHVIGGRAMTWPPG